LSGVAAQPMLKRAEACEKFELTVRKPIMNVRSQLLPDGLVLFV
jgi:hypothetical protein